MDCLNEKLANTSLSTGDSMKERNNSGVRGKGSADASTSLNSATTMRALSQASIMSTQSTATSTSSSQTTSSITSSNSTEDRSLTIEQEYAQFFSDKIDSDPNFIKLVDQLSDIFPHFSKTDLKIRLKLCDDVDQLMEELFIECEQKELIDMEEGDFEKEGTCEPSGSGNAMELALTWYRKPSKVEAKLRLSKYIVETCQLQEIFPDINPQLIEQALVKNKGDMDAASMDLLNPNSIEVNNEKSQGNAWKNNTDLLKQIKEFLNIDNDSGVEADPSKRVLEDEEINFHIRKCLQDYSETLKSIVVNCRPKIREEVTIRNVGGRVQRGGYKNPTKVKKEYRLTPSTYKYKPNRGESLELQHMYLVNEQLQMLEESVLINALEFFEGDFDKVLQFAIEVLSNRPVEQLPTIEFSLSTDTKKKSRKQYPSADLAKNFEKYSSKRRRSSSSLQPQYFANSEEISQYVSDSKVDLHGKTALEALSLTKKVLTAWWQEEIDHRIEHGKLNLYGSSATFVDSLLIITGKGIHSVGGVSIIRRYVKEHLVRSGYLFEEGVGNFEVKGMKKR